MAVGVAAVNRVSIGTRECNKGSIDKGRRRQSQRQREEFFSFGGETGRLCLVVSDLPYEEFDRMQFSSWLRLLFPSRESDFSGKKPMLGEEFCFSAGVHWSFAEDHVVRRSREKRFEDFHSNFFLIWDEAKRLIPVFY